MNNHKVQAPVITALLKAGFLNKSKYPLKREKKSGLLKLMVTCVGGYPNIGDYSSRTPLHNAAQYGSLEVILRFQMEKNTM